MAVGVCQSVAGPLESDLAVRLVKEGVIHQNVECILRIVIDDRITTIAVATVRHRSISRPTDSAVVLRAAHQEVPVKGVQGETLKLRGAEIDIVERLPGIAIVGGAPDAAIVAGVNDLRVRRSNRYGMSIGMKRSVIANEGGTAISRTLHHVASAVCR